MEETKTLDTKLLEKEAEGLSSESELDIFIEHNIVNQYKSFSEYFNEYVGAHDLELPPIIRKSNLDRGYFYNIVNGDKKPGRDKVLCICIGAGMDVKHLNRGLRIAKYTKLDPKDERDLRIRFAVQNGEDNILNINITLDENGLEILR